MTENAQASALGRLGTAIGRCLMRRNTPEMENIEDRNYHDIAESLAQGSQVSFISSFPRSGNTWMRFLLSDIFLQRAGLATTTDLPVPPEKVIPDIYIQLIAERQSELTPGIFVKTHEGFDRLMKHFPAKAAQQCRHIYIYRSPEDALISFYRYHLRDPNLKNKVQDGKDAFCRARVKEWNSSVTSYLRAARNNANLFFVSYEELLGQTGPVLGGILDWLGMDYEEPMVRRAVSNMKFDNMVKEVERGCPANGEFTGRGCPGAGAAELQPETVSVIRKETSAAVAEVSALLSRQNASMSPGLREAKIAG